MFDIYDDHGELLSQIFDSEEELREFIKSAELPDPEEFEKLSSDDFAVHIPVQGGIRPAYPINNGVATAVSLLYFENTHGALPSSLQKQAAINIVNACDKFGLDVPSDSVIFELLKEEEKTASVEPKKIPLPDQGLPGTPWFPLSLPEQVKMASELYPEIIRKLAPDERVVFSQNLLKKCAEYNVPTPAMIGRWAGDVTSKAAVIEAIEKRASYMTEDQVMLLRQYAEKIASMPPEEATKTLYSMDTTLGLEPLYDRGIPDPAAIRAFSQSPYEENTVKIAGLELSYDQLKQASQMGVFDGLDPDLQQTLLKDPESANYLPEPVIEYIKTGLRSAGLVQESGSANFDDIIA